MKSITKEISEYNSLHSESVNKICNLLQTLIDKHLKNRESKIWHGSPVWFLDGNPIVAYSVRKSMKDGERVSLMFFSGQSFDEAEIIPEGKFKAAEIFYTDVKDIDESKLKSWLKKGEDIQWDYKNIMKNKGLLKLR